MITDLGLDLDDTPPPRQVRCAPFTYPLVPGSRAARLVHLLHVEPEWEFGASLLKDVEVVADAVAHLRSLDWSVFVSTWEPDLVDTAQAIARALPDVSTNPYRSIGWQGVSHGLYHRSVRVEVGTRICIRVGHHRENHPTEVPLHVILAASAGQG